jgi:signal transduction histidine kinase
MPEPMPGLRLRDYLVAAGVLVAVFVAWTQLSWPGERPFVNVTTTLVPLLAGLLLARRAAQGGRNRAAWFLLALACWAWATGNLVWTIYELVLHIEAPLPSPADLGYLALLPLAAASLILFMAGGVRASRPRSLLDGLLMAGSLLFVAWPFLLDPIVGSVQGEALQAQVVSLAYAVGDVVLLALVILLLSRTAPQARRNVAWIAFGLVALTIADMGYWYLNSIDAYATGSWTDPGWLVAFLAFGAAALHRSRVETVTEVRPGVASAVVPLLPFVAAAVTAIVVQVRHGFLEPFLFWLAYTNVILLLTRQFLVLTESHQLRRQAESALDRVREQQAERTLMLNAVTHDLMSPLSAARLQVHMLGRRDPDDAARRSLDIVDRNVAAVGRLARDLKDLANLEAGQMHLEAQSVDLAARALQATESFRESATQAGLALTCEAEAPLWVRGDPQRIDQVLYNMVSNAIRYTPSGGTVRVWVHPRRERAVVAVSDTGAGLDPEDIEALFKPFTRLPDAPKGREKGTGLGLYISQSIARSHGGVLFVESPGRGKGSTFFLELPLGPAPPEAAGTT